MFYFANIKLLWLLVTIPVFILAFVWLSIRKRRQLQQFGDPELARQLMPNASHNRTILKFSILMVALTLLIFAAARPQRGMNEQEEEKRGIEMFVALDISNSMLAQDVAPDRLERAKQIVNKLVDNMSDDRVGLVIFAGEAFTQLPITSDYISAKMFMHSISPDLIRTQGTAIGAAINRCIEGFDTEQSDAQRVILIITDGENHEDDAIAAAQRANEAGIKVMVMGIGKPEGTTIPIPGTFNLMKDKEGNPVVTKLNEEMCQQIAQAGEGVYVHCDNSNNALRTILKELEQLSTAKFEGVVYKDYNEQFASFALVAMLLLIIDFFIFNRKNKMLTKLDMFGERGLCLLILLGCSLGGFAQKESRNIRSGNNLYNDSLYDQAEVEYRRALEQNANNFAAQFNLGNALYRQNDSAKYEAAIKAYSDAAELLDKGKKDPIQYAKAQYNVGNCYKQLGKLGQAAEAYAEALRKNPDDDQARENLAKVKEMMKSSSQQQQQGQQGKEQQQDQDQEQEQEQQQQQQDQKEEQQQDQMDKETAEQLLQALEDETPRQPQGSKRPLEKNW